jgi:hypothetical protein
VRHDRFATTLLASTVAVFGGATGCNADRKAPAPGGDVATTLSSQAVSLVTDTVSGCERGAGLVKVLIDLKASNDHCVAEVTPASVCVAPGGVVRFKVLNSSCTLGDTSRPAVEIGQPRFKRPLGKEPPPTEPPTLLQNCVPRVGGIDRSASQVVLCDIAENAVEGFYKYGLTGQIDPLDPDVEVRRGH